MWSWSFGLGHWIGGLAVNILIFGTLPLPFCTPVFLFQRLLLLSVHLTVARAQFDQCDQLEEERGGGPI